MQICTEMSTSILHLYFQEHEQIFKRVVDEVPILTEDAFRPRAGWRV